MASSPLRRWLPAVLTAALAAALAGFAWLLYAAAPPAAPDVGEAAEVLRVPRPVPAFALTDHRGRPFGRSRLEGRWTFLFFGYTFCPDVCPNTLGNLRAVRERIGDSPAGADDVQFVLVSVDPTRDTPERLAQYLPYFHDEFVGVTGDLGEIARLTAALGIHHARGGETLGGDPGSYLVDHTAAVLLVDPQARVLAIYAHPDEPEAMARAFGEIRRLAGGAP